MLNSVIEVNKTTFIFEDTGLEDKQQIINAPTSIESILRALKEHHHSVIVLSRKEKREEIFEIAMKINLLIEFETTTKLRNENVDISMFENKVIVFDKAFDGTTSTTNNTYKNIQRIIEVSEKFVAVDTIGTNYLVPDYFPGTINLMDKNFQFDHSKINNTKYMNQLLIDKFVVLKNNHILKQINDNYWTPGYSVSLNIGEKTSDSNTSIDINNAVNEASIQYGWAGNNKSKSIKSSKEKINLDYKDAKADEKSSVVKIIMGIIIALAIINVVGFFNILGFIIIVLIIKRIFFR